MRVSQKHFCLHKTWVILRVLLIVPNKDLRSSNYRLRACTVWLAMCFALFTATSKSQLLMKNKKKLKEIKELCEKAYERTMMQQQGNTKTAQTQHERKRRHWRKVCFHF